MVIDHRKLSRWIDRWEGTVYAVLITANFVLWTWPLTPWMLGFR